MNINKAPNLSILQNTMNAQDKRMEQMASGKRVNSAADDAAALQIIERMNSEASAYQRSVRNAFDGISMLQVAEGGMQQITNDLQRIRELSIQAGNGILNDNDRQALQSEVEQLRDGIYRAIDTTSMGQQTLLNEEVERGFMVGSGRGSEEQRMTVSGADLRARGLDALDTIDLTSSQGAMDAVSSVDQMRETLDGVRAEFGAQQNAFMSAVNNLTSADVNTQAARSRIRDLDYAQATSESTRNAMLEQASTTILGQANLQRSQVLNLLN